MITLRDYQVEAVEKSEALLRQQISALLVMPTGTGKTTVIGETVRRFLAAPYSEKSRDALIIAHTEELIEQLAERVRLMCPEIDVGVEMGERSCVGDSQWLYGKSRVIVASRQSLEKRMASYARDRFGLLVIDEAHHAPANTYRKIIEHFPEASLLGPTATPDRGDKRSLSTIFQQCAYQMTVDEARDGGWLTPVLQQFCDIEGLDFSAAKTKAGEYDDSKLDRILAAEPRVAHEIAACAAQHCKGQTLLFAPGVALAELVAEILNRHEPDSAEVIVGTTNKQRRRSINEAYKRGDLKYLVGVGVFLEGYDAPNTRYLFNARPFRVRATYAQFAGRVLRPLPGVIDGLYLPQERVNAIAMSAKPHGIIIDLTTASAEHELVFSGDVLGGRDYSPKVRESALRKAKAANGPVDMAKLMEQEDLAFRKQEAEQARRRWVKAQAQSTLRDVNQGVPVGHPDANNGMPTDRQRRFLADHGYDSDGLTRQQAGKLIGQLKQSLNKGTASPKQQQLLARNGLPTDVTKVVASVLLDIVFARRRAGVLGQLDYTPSRDRWKIVNDGTGYRASINDPDVGAIILRRDLPPFRTVGDCRAHFADVFETMPSLV